MGMLGSREWLDRVRGAEGCSCGCLGYLPTAVLPIAAHPVHALVPCGLCLGRCRPLPGRHLGLSPGSLSSLGQGEVCGLGPCLPLSPLDHGSGTAQLVHSLNPVCFYMNNHPVCASQKTKNH